MTIISLYYTGESINRLFEMMKYVLNKYDAVDLIIKSSSYDMYENNIKFHKSKYEYVHSNVVTSIKNKLNDECVIFNERFID